MTDATRSFHTLVADLDYPMFVVTAVAAGERSGCLVGFLSQASIDPPRLLVFLSKANRTYSVAQRAEILAVNFLHEGSRDLAALFGEHTGDEVDKFQFCEWEEGPRGVPVLLDTRGWVVGTIVARLDCGDHVAHLIAVDEAQLRQPGRRFLSFATAKEMTPAPTASGRCCGTHGRAVPCSCCPVCSWIMDRTLRRRDPCCHWVTRLVVHSLDRDPVAVRFLRGWSEGLTYLRSRPRRKSLR